MVLLTPASVFRRHNTTGVPDSGRHEPDKDEIIQLLEGMQGNASNPSIVKQTLSALNAVTPASENYGGLVLTGSDSGYYYRSGGAWVKGRDFPDTFAVLTSVGGTANAITALTADGVSPGSVLCVLLPDPPGTNSSSTVTLALNGGSPESVKAASGANLAVGDIIEGIGTLLFRVGSEWRQLFSSATGATFDHQGDWNSGTTFTEAQIVTGSNGNWYQLKAPSSLNDDPVSGGSGNWLMILASAALPDGSVSEAKLDSALKGKLVAFAPNRTALAALDGDTYQAVDLMEAGRKGLFHWNNDDLSAEVASDPEQGIYVAPASDDTGASGAWVRAFDSTLHLGWFGPSKDGATDDTAVFNSAMAIASEHKTTLQISSGDYAINGGQLLSNVRVVFHPGARFIQPDSVSIVSAHVLKAEGAVVSGSSVNLTANADMGAASVSVASGAEAAFSAGSWAMLEDNDATIKRYELIKVLSVSSGTINFDRPITEPFTTANSAKIMPAMPIENCIVEGQGEIVVGLNRAYGIWFEGAAHCSVREGVVVRRPRLGGGVVFNKAYDCHAYRCRVEDGQSLASSGAGYGFVLGLSSVWCSVTFCGNRNVRESAMTNRARFCTFSNNQFNESYDSGINTHGAGCHDNTIESNVIVLSSSGYCISIGWSGALIPDNNNTVRNNTCIGGRVSIGVSNNTGDRNYGNRISGNHISGMLGGANTAAIRVQNSSDFIVSNNDISNSTMINALWGLNCTDGIISGNTLLNLDTSGGSGVRINGDCSDLIVSKNDVINVTTLSFYVLNGTSGVRLIHNASYDSAAVNITGAAVNAQNSWN